MTDDVTFHVPARGILTVGVERGSKLERGSQLVIPKRRIEMFSYVVFGNMTHQDALEQLGRCVNLVNSVADEVSQTPRQQMTTPAAVAMEHMKISEEDHEVVVGGFVIDDELNAVEVEPSLQARIRHGSVLQIGRYATRELHEPRLLAENMY